MCRELNLMCQLVDHQKINQKVIFKQYFKYYLVPAAQICRFAGFKPLPGKLVN